MKWRRPRLSTSESNLTNYEVVSYPQDFIRLDRNENIAIPSELVMKIIYSAIQNLDVRIYPNERVIDYISDWEDVSPSQVILGNGADDVLYKLSLAFFNGGGRSILNVPTYSMYRWFLERVSVDISEIQLKEDFSLNLEGIRKSYDKDVKAVFICSPNNPTGNKFSKESIKRLLDELDSIVIVDETYSFFSKERAIDLMKEGYENLVIIRSFSKIGFAGIRFGYALASEYLAGIIRMFQPPYSVNSITLAIVEEIIENFNLVEKAIKEVVRERDRLYANLKRFREFDVYPSDANFLLIRVLEGSFSGLLDFLLSVGIVVRDVSSMPLLRNCFRLSVGTRRVNDALLEHIRTFYDEFGGVYNG